MASGAPSSGPEEGAGAGVSTGWDENPQESPADVVVGRVARPIGRRGEVVLQPLTDDPARFLELETAEVGPPGQKGIRRSLESVRIHKGRPVVLFAGISDISSAETLRNLEVRIQSSERVPLPEGRYYSDDLVGCKAESEEGVPLGEIVGTLDTAGPSLLVLRGPDGSEDLIPFVEALCISVEPEAGRVVLSVPDGLLGLNREAPEDGDAR